MENNKRYETDLRLSISDWMMLAGLTPPTFANDDHQPQHHRQGDRHQEPGNDCTAGEDPAVAARLMTRMRAPAEENLSAREIEVLQLVAKGASNEEIGKSLHISTATVKTHLIHIYSKLGVDDRTAAVTTALEKGIITLAQ